MKCVVLLLFCVYFCFGEQVFLDYTGSNGFYGGFYAVRAYPAIYNGYANNCTSNPTYVGYQKFNFTLTPEQSNKVYFFYSLVEKIQMGFAQMQIYYGAFNPLDPCTNLLVAASSRPSGRTGGAPHIFIPLLLQNPGLYTVVLTSSDPNRVGFWGIRIVMSDWSATTGAGNSYWNTPKADVDPTNPSCVPSNITLPYDFYQFQVQTEGYYDFNVAVVTLPLIPNLGITFGFWAGAAANFPGQGTQANPVNPCTSGGYLQTVIDLDANRASIGAAAAIRRVFLQTGVTYTVSVSSRNASTPFATFGLSYGPSATNFIDTDNVNMTYFLSPQWPRDNNSDCLLTYDRPWRSQVFQFTNPVALIDAGPTAIGFDTISFLYKGLNTGSANQLVAPTPCASFVASADTGDIQAIVVSDITPDNYTVVLTTYTSSFPGSSLFILYAMNGPFIFDYIPIVTTGLITTGAITTGITSGPLTSGMDITSGFSLSSGSVTSGQYIPFTTGQACVNVQYCVDACGSGYVSKCGCDEKNDPIIECIYKDDAGIINPSIAFTFALLLLLL